MQCNTYGAQDFIIAITVFMMGCVMWCVTAWDACIGCAGVLRRCFPLGPWRQHTVHRVWGRGFAGIPLLGRLPLARCGRGQWATSCCLITCHLTYVALPTAYHCTQATTKWNPALHHACIGAGSCMLLCKGRVAFACCTRHASQPTTPNMQAVRAPTPATLRTHGRACYTPRGAHRIDRKSVV